MGIDNDLLRALYDYLVRSLSENSYEQAIFQSTLHTNDLNMDEHGRLKTIHPECVISDVTSDIIGIVSSATPTTRPEINSKLAWILPEEIQQTQASNIRAHMLTPLFSNVDRWILLIDSPSEVTAIKALEHEKRGQQQHYHLPGPRPEAQAYTDAQLKVQRILVEKRIANSDLSIDELSEKFGSSSVWGWDLTSLWKTAKLKPIVGRFFMENLIKALRTQVAKTVPRAAGMEIIADGSWPEQGYFCSPCFHTTRPLSSADFVPTSYRSVGEVDIKLTSYLNETFGKSFLIRSDDSDYQPIILLHFLKLLMRSYSNGFVIDWTSSERRRKVYKPMMGIDDLPDVWIDRTTNYLVRKNTENPHRYVNIKRLFQLIALFFGIDYKGRTAEETERLNQGTTTGSSRIANAKEAKAEQALESLGRCIMGVVFIMMIRKTDFTESLEEAFVSNKGTKVSSTATGTSATFPDQDIDMLFASKATQISDTTVRSDKKLKDSGGSSKTKKPRASGKFSVFKLVECLFPCKEWYQCFNVAFNTKTKMLDYSIDQISLKNVLVARLELGKTHRCDESSFKKSIRRFLWIFDYWSNQSTRVAREYATGNFEGGVPARYHGLEVNRQSGNSIHGWRLVRASPKDNPNATHVFSFKDRSLEGILAPSSIRRTSTPLDSKENDNDEDADYDQERPSGTLYRVSYA